MLHPTQTQAALEVLELVTANFIVADFITTNFIAVNNVAVMVVATIEEIIPIAPALAEFDRFVAVEELVGLVEFAGGEWVSVQTD